MSVAMRALDDLVRVLAEAVEPAAVRVVAHECAAAPEAADAHGGADAAAAAAPTSQDVLTVTPLALTRAGRSRRDGPVLDLELVVGVQACGERALGLVEAALVGLEGHGRFTVREAATAAPLTFLVAAPVAVRLPEPTAPIVLEPMALTVHQVRSLVGVVLDADGCGLAGAVVGSPVGGAPATADERGRFRVLGSLDDQQPLEVQVAGQRRTVTAQTDAAPVVIRWE